MNMLYNIKNGTTVPLREWVQLALQIGGVVVIIAGLWLATKLSPLESRINAIEKSLDRSVLIVDRFDVLEERIKEVIISVEKLEKSQTKLEEKIDRLVEEK